MAVIVHLNDIFDMTDPTVLMQRIECAFGDDGTDFWQNFFLCDGYHGDDKVVYLFTEYQLKTLYDWLDKKVKEYDGEGKKRIEANLKLSTQQVFNVSENVFVREKPESKMGKKMRVGCIKYNGHDPYMQPICFKPSPAPADTMMSRRKIPIINFFTGGFKGTPPVESTTETEEERERKRKEKVNEVVIIRKDIADEFGGPDRKAQGWLYYLGHRFLRENHLILRYCLEINPHCPLTPLPPLKPTPAGTDKEAV